jgi:hypothetical protein
VDVAGAAEKAGAAPTRPSGGPEPATGETVETGDDPTVSDQRLQDQTPKKPKRAKPPPPKSLVELYSSKTPSPKAFLREAEKGNSWKFGDDDIEAALAVLLERDPQLTVTRQLVHEAMTAHSGRFSLTGADFAQRALTAALADRPLDLLDESHEPVAALAALAGVLKGDLEQKKDQRRAHNALMIGVDVLSARRGMSLEETAPALAEAVGPPAAYKRSKSNPRRHRVRTVAQPKNDLARVRDLDLLRPWQEAAASAHQREQEADARAREATDAASSADARARELAAELADARARLAEESASVENARSEAGHIRSHAAADLSELRSRSAAFLNSRLATLITTAKEATEANPPSPDTAARLLDQAIKELEREVTWLKSSA